MQPAKTPQDGSLLKEFHLTPPQNHTVPIQREAKQNCSAVRLTEVPTPWAGLTGQGEGLPQYYPQKHQYDVFSIEYSVSERKWEIRGRGEEGAVSVVGYFRALILEYRDGTEWQ